MKRVITASNTYLESMEAIEQLNAELYRMRMLGYLSEEDDLSGEYVYKYLRRAKDCAKNISALADKIKRLSSK